MCFLTLVAQQEYSYWIEVIRFFNYHIGRNDLAIAFQFDSIILKSMCDGLKGLYDSLLFWCFISFSC